MAYMSNDCLFCSIAAGTIPAEVLVSTEDVVAFRDINPQAPLHALVIPRNHYENVADLAATDPALLATVIQTGQALAADEADGQFRVVFNTGARAGQSVFHVHAHIIGGAELGWNPA